MSAGQPRGHARTPQARGHARTVAPLLAVLVAMSALVYYSVPLYRLFCQVTGFGGTPGRAAAAPGAVAGRSFVIRFNADVSPKLAWKVQPVVRQITLRPGAETLAFYRARNLSRRAVTGTSSFNVTPAKAGMYFVKIECFCFTRQTLAAGQTEDMPVTFYVDPAILKDRNLRDVTSITLSYTFFAAGAAQAGFAAGAAKTGKTARRESAGGKTKIADNRLQLQ
ncbi:MAG: cytochrome c oxidase assembly protein [Alphaproteobacteria bacterium]